MSRSTVKHVFISHTTTDDQFVQRLRTKLSVHDISAWTDSQELSAGDDLEPRVQQAIAQADHFLVVLSPKAMQSKWVEKEVRYALEVQQNRTDGYKVIPLLLTGVEPEEPAAKFGFKTEKVAVIVPSRPGGLATAMRHLLASLGEHLPGEGSITSLQSPSSVAELILDLATPTIFQEEGKRRARASATLRYRSPDPNSSEITAEYMFTAPLGPIEMGELTWYLEDYWRWPTGVFVERAQHVETQIPEWGESLYQELFPSEALAVLDAWEHADTRSSRAFSVRIKQVKHKAGKSDAQHEADEAATLLLALPWELLHDGTSFLFQGARGVRVRRQLSERTRHSSPHPTDPPIRVLLVSPRPEDLQAPYIDHRASARPLVDALSALGELATLKILTPPTFPALTEELIRASQAGEAYHVVHFDGHGVYDPHKGLGALCFEDPEDVHKPVKRRSQIVHAETLAASLRDCGVPLFFLDACQTARSDSTPTASVAGKLLDSGVSTVAAMSHSILVETARRFVAAFYQALLKGDRIGTAMLAGRRRLQSDPRRGKSFEGELQLQDWFVPVLYQEDLDPQLVTEVPDRRFQAELKKERELNLGKLPPTPSHTFVGRSRELLAAERILDRKPYVVLRGEGGEGKTTLAVELARWLVETARFDQAAFVAFDRIMDAGAALSVLGNQLVLDYESKAGQGDNRSWLEVERVLEEHPTVIVLDNLESLLPPADDSSASSSYYPEILKEVLDLAEHLQEAGETRLIFTSREALPTPFHNNTIPLGRLSRTDGIALVAKALGEGNQLPGAKDGKENDAEIERLVEAVGGHARSLVLISKEVARTGVHNAVEQLDRLMQQMHARYPDDRERSLLASVELSLRRLPASIREQIRPLGVFQAGGWLEIIRLFLGMEDAESVLALGRQLVGVGLAEPQEHGYLRFDPALTTALLAEMTEEDQEVARSRWVEVMEALAGFLYQQRSTDPEFAFGLAGWEMSNLLAALEYQAKEGEAERVVEFAVRIETLAQSLGRGQAVAQAERIRKQASERLGEWSHAATLAADAAIDRLLNAGRMVEAVAASERLKQRCEMAGEQAYPDAAYDLALAYFRWGRSLQMGGASGAALLPLEEAERRFTRLGDVGSQNAVGMASASRTERADCLVDLGRLEEAANLYEQGIQEDEQRNNPRDVAVGRGQLGTVRMLQRRYPEALQAHHQARDTFEKLGEPRMVATAWHQIGIVYDEAGDYKAAEHYYLEALQRWRLLGDRSHLASSLNQMGLLYDRMERSEEAVRFFQEAAAIAVELQDTAKEGTRRNNAAHSLIKLGRYDEARKELQRAIVCGVPFGHAAQPWKAFALLTDLERVVGDIQATQEAREQAIRSYLAYRQEGGESRDWGARIVAAVKQAIAERQQPALSAQLTPLLQDPDMPDIRKPLLQALLKMLAGTPASQLADHPDLYYMDTVELRLA